MYIMTKINFCYHATVQTIWFSVVWLIDNSLSRTCLYITQCTIVIWLRFYIQCTIVIWLRFYILVWSVSLFFRTILQFTIFVQFLFGCCKLCFCFFHFVFNRLIDFTKHIVNIIFNAGTVKFATTNAYFPDIAVPVANLWGQ